jgi:hypothetical protein
MTEEQEHQQVETDPSESNPNAGGPHGLEGDMGISSERPGPDRSDDEDVKAAGIEGTGSHKSSVGTTDGSMEVDPSDYTGDPSERAGDDERSPEGVANKHQFERKNPGHSHG